MSNSLKKFLPHIVVFIIFVITSLAYFNPVLQGKTLFQSDIAQYQGMAKELKEYREKTGEETYWTDSAFGGMPTYQLGAKYPYNFIKSIDLGIRFLPRPADYLFLYFIGVYILLLVLKIDYKLAFLGAIAFGFSTYLIIILGVGHNAKAHAIAYMPLVLSGIILTFRGKFIWGFLVTAVAMGLELVANHIQMTYYLFLLVVCVGVAYLVDAYKKKMLPHYFKSLGIMVVAVLIAVGLNATNLLATKEYADTSTRGKSELTINADGTPKENTGGLDYDYITTYSYGKLESFNLLIPNFMGGGSGDSLPEDGATFEEVIKLGASPQEAQQYLGQFPSYWGDQPIVAAPAYVGAIIIFLSVLALFLIKGRLKWWAVAAVLLSLLLSWGKNFNFLTEFFINNVPLYDKFRAVSSIQVILELVLPILAIVGLYQYFNDFEQTEKRKKALFWASGITGGVILIFLLFGNNLLDFANPFYDANIREQLGQPFIKAIREDRAAMLRSDAIRSLILIVLTVGVLWFSLKGKLKQTATIALLVLLVGIDLIGVDKRYVNDDDFVQKRVMESPFQPSPADEQILQNQGHFRVYDATTDAFNNGRTSYFHNAVGGYHAAKPGRMQDLNEFYIDRGSLPVLNMLNVKYIITQRENSGPVAQENPYANGNAWFVNNILLADSADDEIALLDSLDTKRVAVVHKDFEDQLPKQKIVVDSSATIDLVSYNPQHLTYEASNTSPQIAVFSEMYYPHGWNAYINGKPAEYFRADYTLRAMNVPAGNNKIEFKFEPKVIQTGSTVSLISFIVLLLLAIGGLYFQFKKRKEAETSAE